MAGTVKQMQVGAICMCDSSKSGLKLIVEWKIKNWAFSTSLWRCKEHPICVFGKVVVGHLDGSVCVFLDMDFEQMLKS